MVYGTDFGQLCHEHYQPHNTVLVHRAARPRSPFSSAASQLRTWEEDGDKLVGICLPEVNQIRVQKANFSFTNFPDWPGDDGVVKLGPIGSGDGEFIFPLSFDIGPDGRFFMVDAGNRRIQVIDRDGNHLTSWGRKGNGDGEFDFGDGLSESGFFAGNVAVDDDGFIYVADVGNKRIQKFAPQGNTLTTLLTPNPRRTKLSPAPKRNSVCAELCAEDRARRVAREPHTGEIGYG